MIKCQDYNYQKETIITLKLLSGLDCSVEDTENEVLSYHRWAEILKFAYAKRSALGDEDFIDIKEVKIHTNNP